MPTLCASLEPYARSGLQTNGYLIPRFFNVDAISWIFLLLISTKLGVNTSEKNKAMSNIIQFF